MSSTVYDAFLGSLNLRQVTSSSFNPGTSIIVGRVSGGQLPSFIAGGASSPRASFASMDVFNALTSVDLSAGLSIASGSIVIPFQKRAQGGTYASGSSHQSITASDALLVITGIEAAQGGDGASVNLDAIFRSTDGLTRPCTLNTAASLTAQAFQALYHMGPVKVQMASESAASQVTQVTRFSVNPGLSVQVAAYDGGNYPTVITIDQQDPSIDLTFEDFDAASRFVSDYTELDSITVYLRKLADGGTFVADATEGHISMTLTGGLITVQSIQAAQGGNGSISLRMTGKAIAKSLAAAISI